jgi:hypothetical protein
MDNNAIKVYVVQVGSYDESPDDVHVEGVYKNLKDALQLRNELFLYNEDEEDYDPEELESMELENGHEFFKVIEMTLR